VIISVHIPKTAGTSFLKDLSEVLGPRLLDDYGDWPETATAEGRAHRDQRRAEVLACADRYVQQYDAIHGHFTARKYVDVFAEPALVTFVRDPYQHAISTHEHATRLAHSPHPDHRTVKEQNMTVVNLVEAFPNHQALYLDGIPIDEFAMVGLAERYEQSVALFEAIFGITMPRVSARRNANPAKQTDEYAIPPEVRQAVDRHRAEDVDLYRRASERFDALCAAYGI
jgi:hypothetical protein